MTSRFNCVFCDHQVRSMQQLCCHVLAKHKETSVSNWRLDEGVRLVKPGLVRCWCGKYLQLGIIDTHYTIVGDLELAHPDADWVGEWGKHLLEEGGLEAHILGLTLCSERG